MLFIGVDPGVKGALCALDPFSDVLLSFCSTPQTKRLHDSLNGIERWLEILKENFASISVAVEDVHSMGGMNAKSNFQFGRNLGLVEALVHRHFDKVEYIQPKEWQKSCGIVFEYPAGATSIEKAKIRKLTTAARCIELYPNSRVILYGPRGGLMDGRSDALMITHALWRKHEAKTQSESL